MQIRTQRNLEVRLTETHLKGPPRWEILEETPLLLFFLNEAFGARDSDITQGMATLQEDAILTRFIQEASFEDETCLDSIF